MSNLNTGITLYILVSFSKSLIESQEISDGLHHLSVNLVLNEALEMNESGARNFKTLDIAEYLHKILNSFLK